MAACHPLWRRNGWHYYFSAMSTTYEETQIGGIRVINEPANADAENLVVVSEDRKIGSTDYYSADTSEGALVLALASDAAKNGNVVSVKRNGPNLVTIETEGGETIDGSSSVTLTSDNNAIKMVYNSSTVDWEIY